MLSRLKLWRCEKVGLSPRVLGRVYVRGQGRVVIGDRVVLDGRSAPIELHALEGGEIILGDDVRIEGGASLEALESIFVGNRCVLGGFCKVLDNNFHPVRGDRHQRPESMPVMIEPFVTIGVRAILLPGAHLQTGSRVGPGAVVTRRVPAGVEVAGMPLKVVKRG